MFDSSLFTYNPKLDVGLRNQPFITRPAQAEVLREFAQALRVGEDRLVDKSRDEGATELVCKFYAIWAMLNPETSFLVGSRKEEYVDAATQIVGNRVVGSHKTLFHKILYTWATCPIWMRPKLNKTHMHIEIPDIGSTIDGEATNENFGAGDRRTGVLLDEFGANDPVVATHIRNRVADVTNAVIYVSTHYYGIGHPFGKLRFSGKVKVLTLPWYKNPDKNQGLYRSPDLNVVEIHDPKYYKEVHPELGNLSSVFKLSDLEVSLLGIQTSASFVPDGLGKWRSPWYDRECVRRDARDIASNLDMNPSGSGDMFYDVTTLQRIRADQVKPHTAQGEIHYTVRHDKVVSPSLRPIGGDRAPFQWWGELSRNRPLQYHTYVVGCDISLGTGQSNSVASIVDCNEQKEVGKYVTSSRSPEEFCDDVMALCSWVGGQTHVPFLVWEANGPGGIFDQRRRKYGYYLVYMDTITRSRKDKRTKKPGWYSGKAAKYDLLLELRTSLAEGIKDATKPNAIQIYDAKTLAELEDFIFFENGDVGLTASMEESAGASAAHGDRVIALALAVRGMRYQPRGTGQQARFATVEDLRVPANRLAKDQEDAKQARKNSPWLL
jgi:hypothetical protein